MTRDQALEKICNITFPRAMGGNPAKDITDILDAYTAPKEKELEKWKKAYDGLEQIALRHIKNLGACESEVENLRAGIQNLKANCQEYEGFLLVAPEALDFLLRTSIGDQPPPKVERKYGEVIWGGLEAYDNGKMIGKIIKRERWYEFYFKNEGGMILPLKAEEEGYARLEVDEIVSKWNQPIAGETTND